MKYKQKALLFALVFPIICLIALTVYKGVKLYSGTKIIIPVSGYDPRNLLSGHYLIYQVNYNPLNPVCEKAIQNYNYYMCVKQLPNHQVESYFLSYSQPSKQMGCHVVIEGQCENTRFHAGIERFYIPEEHAYDLDQAIRNKQAKIIISVDYQGNAMVKDLLIEGIPWLQYIQKAKQNIK